MDLLRLHIPAAPRRGPCGTLGDPAVALRQGDWGWYADEPRPSGPKRVPNAALPHGGLCLLHKNRAPHRFRPVPSCQQHSSVEWSSSSPALVSPSLTTVLHVYLTRIVYNLMETDKRLICSRVIGGRDVGWGSPWIPVPSCPSQRGSSIARLAQAPAGSHQNRTSFPRQVPHSASSVVAHGHGAEHFQNRHEPHFEASQ